MKVNEKVEAMVTGYKVLDVLWSWDGISFQCPSQVEADEKNVFATISFWKRLSDLKKMFPLEPDQHVVKVISYGSLEDYDSYCLTDKLLITEELNQNQIDQILQQEDNVETGGQQNVGFENVGDLNTGNYNDGNNNTGSYNTGNGNTGDHNDGPMNTGCFNAGGANTGDWNDGVRNTSDFNFGNCNSGFANTGDGNTGNGNDGKNNTGNYNTGNENVGSYNAGNNNVGDFNIASEQVGCFNTESGTKIRLFNKPSDWTYEQWILSPASSILCRIPTKTVKWIKEEDMTKKEKKAHPSYIGCGGYLKKTKIGNRRQQWWDSELTSQERNIIKAIPNFKADIFYKCTGIRVD